MSLRPQPRYQVFVSSTKLDLERERSAVSEALQRAGYIPAGMELFPSASRNSLSVIRQVIGDSDYYLLIIGSRYGATLPNGMSFTEFEYCYARRLHKHPLAFIPSRRLSCSTETQTKKQRLSRFIKLLESDLNVSYYDTPEDLAAKILSSLPPHIGLYPTPGWVRADSPELARVVYDADERVAFYKALRRGARKSVFIFGVGMRQIINDLDSIATQLQNGCQIRMMCLNSKYIRRQRASAIFNRFFSSSSLFSPSNDYLSEIDKSICCLKLFIRSRSIRKLQSLIELRTYNFFPTTNMTCVDAETSRGKMVFELVMQGDVRLTLPGLTKRNLLFAKYQKIFDSYWNNGTRVAHNK